MKLPDLFGNSYNYKPSICYKKPSASSVTFFFILKKLPDSWKKPFNWSWKLFWSGVLFFETPSVCCLLPLINMTLTNHSIHFDVSPLESIAFLFPWRWCAANQSQNLVMSTLMAYSRGKLSLRKSHFQMWWDIWYLWRLLQGRYAYKSSICYLHHAIT